jgi:hypothetical protein
VTSRAHPTLFPNEHARLTTYSIAVRSCWAHTRSDAAADMTQYRQIRCSAPTRLKSSEGRDLKQRSRVAAVAQHPAPAGHHRPERGLPPPESMSTDPRAGRCTAGTSSRSPAPCACAGSRLRWSVRSGPLPSGHRPSISGTLTAGDFVPVSSEAVLVMRHESFAIGDLRVDEHPVPGRRASPPLEWIRAAGRALCPSSQGSTDAWNVMKSVAPGREVISKLKEESHGSGRSCEP